MTVTDYIDNFDGADWEYHWNAPVGWNTSGSSGNLSSNAIDDPNLVLNDLIKNSSGLYVPDGDTTWGNNPPAGFLNLGGSGGHPGDPGIFGGVDRFAVASFTVSQSGYYTIADSKLDLTAAPANSGADGVEFRVFVNRNMPVETGIVAADTIGYFDTELGFLAEGDTVHVAFGPGDTNWYDGFGLDYTIYRHDDRVLEEASYLQDFSLSSNDGEVGYALSDGGWSYLWNAPDNWVSGTSSGTLGTGEIGNRESYLPMVHDVGTWWSPDGDNVWNRTPDGHLNLQSSGGHTGRGNGLAGNVDRFAIAAYTVPQSGHYALNDAWVKYQSSPSAPSDGVEVFVHVGDGDQIEDATVLQVPGVKSYFDADLGYIKKGETIYVGFGPNGDHANDSFETDFDVVRVVPRAAPNTSLADPGTTFTTINVDTASTGSDYDKILAALATAKTTSGNKKVVFSNKTYNVSAPANTPKGQVLFNLAGMENVLIEGNGARILVGEDTQPAPPAAPNPDYAYTRGLFHIYQDAGTASQNILFEDLTIDYAKKVDDHFQPLTFTQGVIQEVGSDYIVLEIDDASISGVEGEFHIPDTELGSPNPAESEITYSAGYVIDAVVPGRLKAGVDWAYYVVHDKDQEGIKNSGSDSSLNDNEIRVDLYSTDGLAVNDRFVLGRRDNSGAVFHAGSKSKDITLDNVSVYTGPTVAFSAQLAENINVINSEVAIRPNSTRLRSVNADGMHIQSNETGAWVENTKFEGLGDDIMNFYTLPATIHTIVDTKTFELGTFFFGSLFNTALENYEQGDKLVFLNPTTGKVIREARIVTAVEGSTINAAGQTVNSIKVTIDQEIPGALLNLATGSEFRAATTVYNSSITQGFYVKDNILSNSRRYGNFVMANNGHIVDNLYDGVSDQAIAGHNENGWPLGLFADDILIQGNDFMNTAFSRPYLEESYQTGVVSFNMDRISYNSQTGVVTSHLADEAVYEYSDIDIRDNVFYNWNKTAISVRNAERVTVANNVAVAGDDKALDRDIAFEVQYTDDVTLIDNAVVDANYGTLSTSGNSGFNDVGVTEIRDGVLEQQKRVWVKFDETNGTLIDHSTNGFTVSSNGSSSSGRLDRGYELDGTENVYLNDGKTSGYIENRTVGVWFRQDSDAPSGKQVIYEEGSSFRGLNIYLDQGYLYFGRWNGVNNAYASIEFDVTEEWNHVSLVLDKSVFQMRGYLNGREIGSVIAGPIQQHGGWIDIGKANDTRFHDGVDWSTVTTGFKGRIDDFRIYDTALSDAQVAALALRPIGDYSSPGPNPNPGSGM